MSGFEAGPGPITVLGAPTVPEEERGTPISSPPADLTSGPRTGVRIDPQGTISRELDEFIEELRARRTTWRVVVDGLTREQTAGPALEPRIGTRSPEIPGKLDLIIARLAAIEAKLS